MHRRFVVAARASGAALPFIAAIFLSSAPTTVRAADSSCDSACLGGVLDGYVAALIAHDPKRIPTAADVRFVENGVELSLGTALWRTATGTGKYRHYFTDVRAGQAGLIATVEENGKGGILVLRLKVDGGRIAEIEQLMIRDPNGFATYEKLGTPDPLWNRVTPEGDRISREELAALADKYYTGMQRNDPKGDYTFFHKDCNRVEHGRQTTNMPRSNYGHSDNADFVTLGCEAQFQTGFLGFVTRIRDRRYAVIDEERQTVLAFGGFDHNGTIRSIPLSDGKTFNVPPYFSSPRTLTIAEGFKIASAKLRLIEATLTESPYGMQNFFSRAPAANAAPAAEPPASCDRACWKTLTDSLLAAMIAHDPVKAPLAANARYTENGQPLALGDGLWGTLTARGAYNVYLADGTASGGLFGTIVETDIPGMLTLRLRQAGGKLSEIEAVVVRQEIPMLGQLIGTRTLMAPPVLAEYDSTAFAAVDPALTIWPDKGAITPRTTLAAVVDEYAAAVGTGKSAAAPFAKDCSARENGKPAPAGCAASIDAGISAAVTVAREHRNLVVDEDQGLVLALLATDHDGTAATLHLANGAAVNVPDAFRVPSTYYEPALFKVRRGEIVRVETLVRPVFYGLTTGWQEN